MSPLALIDMLDSLSLDEVNESAPLLRRVDTKYLVDQDMVTDLVAGLAESHRVLEIDGRRSFHYLSRYLDTPDYSTYRAHVQGRRRRFKCRIRHYLDSGEQLLEVKAKGARGETVKYREPCDPGPQRHHAFIDECLTDAYGAGLVDDLRPVLDVSYRRTTMVSRSGPERVTLDHGLSFVDLASGREFTVDTDTWIIETKSVTGRGTADTWLREAHVRPLDVSKYIVGLAATHSELRVNKYLHLLRSLGALGTVSAVA